MRTTNRLHRDDSGRAQTRSLGAMAVTAATVGALLAMSGPSNADVTATRGEAFGYRASVSLFGGPPNTRGPEPIVTLPATGAAPSLMADLAEGLVQFGPATIFSSGSITVSTQGTLGPDGSVTSLSYITNANRSGQEVFYANRVYGSCTASETGLSGWTYISNGTLRTSEGNPDVEGDDVVVNIPNTPAPNTAINGTIEAVGDNFQAIFNEQVVNPDGSITVTAYHLRLLGPTAVGDLYVGQVTCGVTGTGLPPTTVSTTLPVTTTTSTTSTTLPVTTTTSLPPTTTTTRLATTTTTAPTTCGGLAFTIVGTGGNDTIFGTPGPDVIFGGGGSDDIQGLGGDDTICGGAGNDRILGGDGNDRLFGDAGPDQLFGGNGNDVLNGGTEPDQCNGEAGTDSASACEVITGLP